MEEEEEEEDPIMKLLDMKNRDSIHSKDEEEETEDEWDREDNSKRNNSSKKPTINLEDSNSTRASGACPDHRKRKKRCPYDCPIRIKMEQKLTKKYGVNFNPNKLNPRRNKKSKISWNQRRKNWNEIGKEIEREEEREEEEEEEVPTSKDVSSDSDESDTDEEIEVEDGVKRISFTSRRRKSILS